MLDGRRVVLVQPYVPKYREPFFSALRQRLEGCGARLVVTVDRDQVQRNDHSLGQVDRTVGSRLRGHVRWRPLRSLNLGTDDLVVMEQALKNVEAYPLALRPRYLRPGLAFWGHGRFSGQSPALDTAKQKLTGRADWFFAYSDRGAEWVVQHGFPATRLSVVRNTIDGVTLARQLCAVSPAQLSQYRESMGLTGGATALFIGGVDRDKRIEDVVSLAAVVARRDPQFVLLVAGDGSDLAWLRERAVRMPWLRVLGRLEGRKKALALRASSAVVMPRAVGLVAVDAIVANLPVIALRDRTHGPEYDYLAPAGLLRQVSGGEAALADALIAATQGRPDRAAAEWDAESCLRRGLEWGIDGMADRFLEGLTMWAEIRSSRL